MSEKPPKGEINTTREQKLSSEVMRNAWELEYATGIDALTGASTRKVFEEELGKAVEAIRRDEQQGDRKEEPLKKLSIAFIDLDHFKQVNDTYGHQKGDEVLVRLVEILRESVRDADIVARFGGDEFYLFLPRTSADVAHDIVDGIRGEIQAEFADMSITASIGICSVDKSTAADVKTLIGRADAAVYEAKRGGRNRIAVFENTKDESLRAEVA
jgi:diguanylate cyclase (GGDEF)-like protein